MDTNIRELKRKNYPIVIALCFVAFMASLDSYIVTISLPNISEYFKVSMNAVSSVVVVFMLFLVGAMLIAGKLADTIGLRKFLIYGYLIFVAGSLACGLSESLMMLNIARAVQGIGAAVMTVTPFTIISKHLPSSITGWAFGLLSTSSALGLTIGSPLGGFITEYYSWHWIFLINVPVGLVAAVFSYKVLPKAKPPSLKLPAKKFDIAGSLISFLAIALLTFVLSQGKDMGWTSMKTIGLSLIFVVLFVLLIFVEKRAKHPVFELSLFKNRVFTMANLATIFIFIFISGNFFLLPFYLTSFAGLNTQNAGLVLMVYSIVYMIAGPLAGKASDKIKPAKLCVIAAFFSALGCLLFAFFLDVNSLVPVIILQVWMGIFMGLFISPNNNLVMSSTSIDERGVASGMFTTLSRLSMIIGVIVFEIIFSTSTSGGGNALINSMSQEVMAHGFKVTYFTAAGILIIGFAFSLAIIWKKPKQLI